MSSTVLRGANTACGAFSSLFCVIGGVSPFPHDVVVVLKQ